MAYVIPQFPLVVWIFRFGNPPPGAGPDVITTGNLSPGRRVMVSQGPPPLVPFAPLLMEVLLPDLTDVRGWNDAGGRDWVEIPGGSGRIYECVFVDDIAKGFNNVHRFAVLAQVTPWPTPIP